MRIATFVLSLLAGCALAAHSQPVPKQGSGTNTKQGAAAGKQVPATKSGAQSSPAAQRCDALAGHPGDPGHKGAGVSDEDLVPAEAIQYCTSAMQQQPKNARLVFQLGRAYWVRHQYDKAVKYLLDAEELKYPAAYHYIGLAYEQGRVKGEKPDKEFARELYQMAASEGFQADSGSADAGPAEAPKAALVVEKAEDLDASLFKEPQIVRALFSGDVDKLNSRRSSVLAYVRGMQEYMTLDPNEFDATCLKVADPSLSAMLDPEAAYVKDGKIDLAGAMSAIRQAMNSPRAFVADAQRNQEAVQRGVDDMNVLSEDYGSCKGKLVQRIYATMKRFVRETPKAPPPPPPAPPRGFEPLSSSRDRAPQGTDVLSASDRTQLDRLRQELTDVAARGYVVTECIYGAGATMSALRHWKNAVPPLSDALRATMQGVLPIALARCPKQENVSSAIRNAIQARMPPVEPVASSPTLADVRNLPFPPALPPDQELHRQAALSMRSFLLACQFPNEPSPVLYWKGALPLSGNAPSWDFLQFVNTYWRVLPVAADTCPASVRLSVAESTFRNY